MKAALPERQLQAEWVQASVAIRRTETRAAPRSAVGERPPREVQATTRQRRGAEGAQIPDRPTKFHRSFSSKTRENKKSKKSADIALFNVVLINKKNTKISADFALFWISK
ncbi:hypothetical protein D3C80_1320080 [compost metagenome]